MTPSGARASTLRRLPESLDTLPMQRVDLQAISSGDFAQQSSRLQQDFVRGSVLHVERHRIHPRGGREMPTSCSR